MKYVRAKEGVYELMFPNTEYRISFSNKTIEPAYFTTKRDFVAKKDVIKASDNIEDLFDKLVWVTPEGEHHIKPKTGDGLWYLCCDYKKGHQIYGAIWTDKGLIYVTKLNNDGWELLTVKEEGIDYEILSIKNQVG